MLSKSLIEKVGSGLSVAQALSEARQEFDVFDDPNYYAYMQSQAEWDEVEDKLDSIDSDYKKAFKKMEQAAKSVENFMSYNADLEVDDSETELLSKDADSEEWSFAIKDLNVDGERENLIDDLRELEGDDYDFSDKIPNEYRIGCSVFVKPSTDIKPLLDLIDDYRKTGKDPKALCKQIQALPYVTEICFYTYDL